MPLRGLFIPSRAYNFVLQGDILIKAMLRREIFEILEDLLGRGIIRRPICFRLKRPSVAVRGHVAGTAEGTSFSKEQQTEIRRCQRYPGYLFSYHVPETSGFFSKTCSSKSSKCRWILYARSKPEAPAPIQMTFRRRWGWKTLPRVR